VKNKIEQTNPDVKIIRGSFTSQSERQLIFQWLDAQFYHSLGITVFLDRTQGIDAQWQLLRLDDSNQPNVLLGVAVVLAVDNHNGKELVFSATKFALRGIAQSLREILCEHLIGVSVLNLGYLASEYEIDKPTKDVLEQTEYSLIPLADVIQAIHFVLSTSKASCVKEILMPAMLDTNV